MVVAATIAWCNPCESIRRVISFVDLIFVPGALPLTYVNRSDVNFRAELSTNEPPI